MLDVGLNVFRVNSKKFGDRLQTLLLIIRKFKQILFPLKSSENLWFSDNLK